MCCRMGLLKWSIHLVTFNTKIQIPVCRLLYSRYDLERGLIFKMSDGSFSCSGKSLSWFYEAMLCCWPSSQTLRSVALNVDQRLLSFSFLFFVFYRNHFSYPL